jgi:acyl CoA:acetate/3-ketoacid CoA transferase alpha subunit
LSARITTLADAVGAIPDGASVAVTKFNPMEAARELIRQRRVGLHLIGVPTASFAVDLLI